MRKFTSIVICTALLIATLAFSMLVVGGVKAQQRHFNGSFSGGNAVLQVNAGSGGIYSAFDFNASSSVGGCHDTPADCAVERFLAWKNTNGDVAYIGFSASANNAGCGSVTGQTSFYWFIAAGGEQIKCLYGITPIDTVHTYSLAMRSNGNCGGTTIGVRFWIFDITANSYVLNNDCEVGDATGYGNMNFSVQEYGIANAGTYYGTSLFFDNNTWNGSAWTDLTTDGTILNASNPPWIGWVNNLKPSQTGSDGGTGYWCDISGSVNPC